MSARKGCPFCGHMHVKVVLKGRKAFLECLRREARGPRCHIDDSPQMDWACEAAARWDDRA